MERTLIAPNPETVGTRPFFAFLGMPALLALAMSPAIVLAIIGGEGLLAAGLLVLGPVSGIWQYHKWRWLARRQLWIDDAGLHIAIPGQPKISYRKDEILSVRVIGYYGWRDQWRNGTWQDFPKLSIHGRSHGPFLLWRDEAYDAQRAIHAWWKSSDV